jgi:hypothetical protein
MKSLKLIYIISTLVTITILTACEDWTYDSDDYSPSLDDQYLRVSPYYDYNGISFPGEGGDTTLTVTTGNSWEITNIPEWLTVTPTKGSSGSTKVHITAQSNIFYAREDRSYRSQDVYKKNTNAN